MKTIKNYLTKEALGSYIEDAQSYGLFSFAGTAVAAHEYTKKNPCENEDCMSCLTCAYCEIFNQFSESILEATESFAQDKE